MRWPRCLAGMTPRDFSERRGKLNGVTRQILTKNLVGSVPVQDLTLDPTCQTSFPIHRFK